MIQEKMSTYPDTSVIVEKEKFVLSAMLLKNGECIPAVIEALKPDDFYRRSHSKTFTAIAKIYLRGDIPNVLTLVEDLRKSGDLENIGGIEFIYSLAEYANTTAYVEQFCRDIKAAADNRRLVNIAAKIDEDAKTGTVTVADIIASATTAFSAITAGSAAPKIFQINDWLVKDCMSYLERMNSYAKRSTGFKNLDELQILTPGIYLVGGTAGSGKTTFCQQLLEQLARNGEDCIYCSYEMSKDEIFMKSVARQIFHSDPFTRFTASNIFRLFDHDSSAVSTVVNAMDEVAKLNLNFRTIELGDENIDDVLSLMRSLCNNSDKPPVICIDYLQIMDSETENRKVAVDNCLRKLKTFQRDTQSTMFIISSFNRTNYSQPVSYESFKESGGIEYTSDIIWGLQLDVVNRIPRGTEISKIREMVEEAKKEQPRQIQMKCIKNRRGANYECYFNYYAAHDTFEPCDGFDDIEGPPETKNNSADNEKDDF